MSEQDNFKVIGNITGIEIIAANHSIRVLDFLNRNYGHGRWRKLKGIALVQFEDNTLDAAEVHWYEAHGIGKRQIKIKRLFDYEEE